MTKLEELGLPEYASDPYFAVGILWARHIVPQIHDPGEAKGDAGARIAARMNEVAVEQAQRLAPHLAGFALVVAELARGQAVPGKGFSILVDNSVPTILQEAAVRSGIVPEAVDDDQLLDLFGRTAETRVNKSESKVIATIGEAGEFEPVWPPDRSTLTGRTNSYKELS